MFKQIYISVCKNTATNKNCQLKQMSWYIDPKLLAKSIELLTSHSKVELAYTNNSKMHQNIVR